VQFLISCPWHYTRHGVLARDRIAAGALGDIRLVNQNLGSVVVLIIGVFIAYFIGWLLCLVGLLVAAPVALLALTYGYRKLQGEEIAA
jgi:uncharacterized membrane protein